MDHNYTDDDFECFGQPWTSPHLCRDYVDLCILWRLVLFPMMDFLDLGADKKHVVAPRDLVLFFICICVFVFWFLFVYLMRKFLVVLFSGVAKLHLR